jgi:hypothetical protein
MMWMWVVGMMVGMIPQQQAAVVPVAGDAGGAAVVNFELDWPAAPVPHWAIAIYEDGSGRYDNLAEGARPSAETKQKIAVSAETLEKLRAGYGAVSRGGCETKLKNLAKTGEKHIAYTMPHSDAWTSCVFNYSDDRALMDAVEAMQAIAETMQAGERLQHLHRFDRLGLDAAIDQLDAEAKEGHAIELGNIAPALQSIVDDERVIERARRKAARLLQSAVVDTKAR